MSVWAGPVGQAVQGDHACAATTIVEERCRNTLAEKKGEVLFRDATIGDPPEENHATDAPIDIDDSDEDVDVD